MLTLHLCYLDTFRFWGTDPKVSSLGCAELDIGTETGRFVGMIFEISPYTGYYTHTAYDFWAWYEVHVV